MARPTRSATFPQGVPPAAVRFDRPATRHDVSRSPVQGNAGSVRWHSFLSCLASAHVTFTLKGSGSEAQRYRCAAGIVCVARHSAASRACGRGCSLPERSPLGVYTSDCCLLLIVTQLEREQQQREHRGAVTMLLGARRVFSISFQTHDTATGCCCSCSEGCPDARIPNNLPEPTMCRFDCKYAACSWPIIVLRSRSSDAHSKAHKQHPSTQGLGYSIHSR